MIDNTLVTVPIRDLLDDREVDRDVLVTAAMRALHAWREKENRAMIAAGWPNGATSEPVSLVQLQRNLTWFR